MGVMNNRLLWLLGFGLVLPPGLGSVDQRKREKAAGFLEKQALGSEELLGAVYDVNEASLYQLQEWAAEALTNTCLSREARQVLIKQLNTQPRTIVLPKNLANMVYGLSKDYSRFEGVEGYLFHGPTPGGEVRLVKGWMLKTDIRQWKPENERNRDRIGKKFLEENPKDGAINVHVLGNRLRSVDFNREIIEIRHEVPPLGDIDLFMNGRGGMAIAGYDDPNLLLGERVRHYGAEVDVGIKLRQIAKDLDVYF